MWITACGNEKSTRRETSQINLVNNHYKPGPANSNLSFIQPNYNSDGDGMPDAWVSANGKCPSAGHSPPGSKPSVRVDHGSMQGGNWLPVFITSK